MKEITKDTILNNIEINDLSGDMRMLAEMISIEFVKQLLSVVDGLTLHVQSVDTMNSAFKKTLLEHFDCRDMSKQNILYISKKTDKSYKTIRRILKQIHDENI